MWQNLKFKCVLNDLYNRYNFLQLWRDAQAELFAYGYTKLTAVLLYALISLLASYICISFGLCTYDHTFLSEFLSTTARFNNKRLPTTVLAHTTYLNVAFTCTVQYL